MGNISGVLVAQKTAVRVLVKRIRDLRTGLHCVLYTRRFEKFFFLIFFFFSDEPSLVESDISSGDDVVISICKLFKLQKGGLLQSTV